MSENERPTLSADEIAHIDQAVDLLNLIRETDRHFVGFGPSQTAASLGEYVAERWETIRFLIGAPPR